MREDPSRAITVDRSPPEPLTPDELRASMARRTVFISSVMGGVSDEREAARGAIESIGGKVSMFELLGGQDDHAETAYLTGVQSSDIYVGILGARYGTPDRTGYAPTHAEYNEAIKAGLRISVWATTAEMDGRQRDFLNEVRTFHTTGSYSNPDELREALKRRLTEGAAAEHSPWCKVGHVLFRARRYADDGTRIIVEASVRDDDIVAELERLRHGAWHGRQESRITCARRTHTVEDNPLPAIAQIGLDEDSFAGAAEVLLIESLVGSGRAERITALRIGPARSGRPLRLEWKAPRRFPNVEPERRLIEGKLHS